MNDRFRAIQRVLSAEASALTRLAAAPPPALLDAVDRVLGAPGIAVTGVGKAGIIGRKFSSTLASVGFPGFFIEPTEALHGDLGRLRAGDLVVAFSWSGRSDELLTLLPLLRDRGHPTVLLTGDAGSPLARLVDLVVALGPAAEACPLGLAPSVSTTMLLAAADAIALTAMEERHFDTEAYAGLHPGGALGRSLRRLDSLMRPLAETAMVTADASLRHTLREITLRRTGAAFVVDVTAGERTLVGVFTDGDLRRHLDGGGALDVPVADVMTRPGRRVEAALGLAGALKLVEAFRIGELPVVQEGRLIGHLATKDLIAGNFLEG